VPVSEQEQVPQLQSGPIMMVNEVCWRCESDFLFGFDYLGIISLMVSL
jgi:hypothetical protein